MKGIVTICALAAYAGTASAQVMVFTDRAAWEAAAGGGVVVEDFNSTATGDILPGATLDTGLLQITRDGSANNADGDLAISPGSTFGNIDGTTWKGRGTPSNGGLLTPKGPLAKRRTTLPLMPRTRQNQTQDV